MIREFIKAFLLIFIAEMGDKTQIIAMTFATQHKVKDVIKGVIIGVALNHGIAIILGRFISKAVPLNTIQIIAGIMFVAFGIMALKDEGLDESRDRKNFGPIATVAIAFFIGELGDKTQLTAMTLSSEATYPLFILIGTTLGMVATSGFGIFIGSRIGEKIPDVGIKISSSLVFIVFGSLKLYTTLPKDYINLLNIILYLLIVLFIELIMVSKLLGNRKVELVSPYKKAASQLYYSSKIINEALDNICLGEDKCGKCAGANCLIGYTRLILKQARESDNFYIKTDVDMDSLLKKGYDIDIVLEALSIIILEIYNNNWDNSENFVINKVKNSLEIIAFGEGIHENFNLQEYLYNVKMKNKKNGRLLEEKIIKSLKNN